MIYTNNLWRNVMTSKSRLGIFVFYDSEGIVGGYVDYLLDDLSKNLTDLCVICNGKLSPEGRVIFEKFASKIIVRENKGFEATAWKEAVLTYLGIEYLQQFDEVVFMNDICYGPIYPFSVIFDQMETRDDVDFWGLTRHYRAVDFTGCHPDHIIPEHIQTYFFVIKRRVLLSQSFLSFWQNLPVINTYMDDIGHFETKLTQYFENCGFKWDTFVDMAVLKGKGLNNYCFNYEKPYTLIKDFKFPLIRRKSLSQTIPNSLGGPEKEAWRCINYIANATEYDVNLIWDDLLRKNNVKNLHSRLHLNFVIPSNSYLTNMKTRAKVALVIHIYYEDEIQYCFEFAKNMPQTADVYITTPAKNLELVTKIFEQMHCNKLDIRIANNRGRDVAALFVTCKDVLESDYDYICCIHDKKSPQVGILFGANFRDLTFENMLQSKEYVENIIHTFDENPRLGYLGFPKMLGGPYWPVMYDSWAAESNFATTQQILDRCGIHNTIERNLPPIVYGNVFWCRPIALKPIVDLALEYNDFPEEPMAIDGTFSHGLERVVTYVAQSQGYYSGVAYTDEYASIYLSALMEEATKLHKSHNSLSPVDFNSVDCISGKQLLKLLHKKILRRVRRILRIPC